MPKFKHDDELIVPLEILRQFAAAYNDPQRPGGFQLQRQLTELAKAGLIERGLHDTPYEPGSNMVYDAFYSSAEYLKDKDYFTPEEQKDIASALRNMGRCAYHYPQMGLGNASSDIDKSSGRSI